MRAMIFVFGHTLFNTFAQICYKLSTSGGVEGFALWQLIGNTSAFVGTLSYTMSMRWLPLHIAYPLTQGLAVIAVQVVGSWLVFRESISPLQWLGTLLVGAGIALIGFKPADERTSAQPAVVP